MAVTYTFPTAADLIEIEQSLLPQLTQDDPLFDILPIENKDSDILMWEQKDDYYGLATARSLNAPATKVDPVGLKRYRMEPGYYAEFMSIDELELTRRRQIGTFNQNIDISDLVMDRQEMLLTRRIARIKKIGWDLLSSGTFSVADPLGGIRHTDTYTTQTFNSSVAWSTAATSTPLADFRAVQLKHRGYSVSFGKDAMAFMNRTTWNYLIANTNAADLYGRRTQGLGTYENVDDVNKLFAGDDLPQIYVYDEFYKADASDTDGTLFIPNNKVIVVGKRKSGVKVGNYWMTRNAQNPDLGPGPFTMVRDSGDYQEVPRKIEVHDWHNGGPVLLFPSSIVIMDVS